MDFINKIKELYNIIRNNEIKENFNIPQNPSDLLNNPIFSLDDFSNNWYDSLKEVVNLTDSTSSKNFASQLFAGREESSLLADITSSILNISMYTYKVAGINAVIEKITIDKLLKLYGIENGEGIFNPGGSISNLIAIMAARNYIFPQIKDKGNFSIKYPIIYTSESSHYSISKSANILGLGRESVCFVPVDEKGKMIPEILNEYILRDLNQGKNPFLIVATSGTTVLGSFDEISKISKISKKYNLWLHIDGSYGLSVGFSQKRKHLIYGIEDADSMTFNPHKSLGVTQQCSVLLLKEKGILEKTLSDEAPYLFQIDSEYNFGQKSILCGRRNDAIKLWALWKNLGDKGIENRVEQQFNSVQDMINLLNAKNGFKLEYVPEFLNICFNYKEISARKICDYLYNKGLAKVSHGSFKDKTFIRYTCLNPNFTKENHNNILEKIERI